MFKMLSSTGLFSLPGLDFEQKPTEGGPQPDLEVEE